jgi:ActR/RegA family two-component response regulator
MTLQDSLAWVRRAIVAQAVVESAGNRTVAARKLGIHRNHINRILNKPLPEKDLRAEYPKLAKICTDVNK